MGALGYAMNEPGQEPRYVDRAASADERMYSMFNHLVGLVSLGTGVAIGGLIAAIIMWRIKHKESPFLDDHGRESVNFQISLLSYAIGGILFSVLFSVLTFGLGAVIVAPAAAVGGIGLIVLNLVGCIRGAIAANRGEYYRYPMCLRFITEPDEPTST